jgi:hypothetical protein
MEKELLVAAAKRNSDTPGSTPKLLRLSVVPAQVTRVRPVPAQRRRAR